MENNPEEKLILEVKNLEVIFPGSPDFVAINNLTFSMKSGKTLALVGQSGSGKSVTSLAIMGLLPPQTQIKGKIFLKEQEISGYSSRNYAAIRGKEIGMVFQEPMSALNPIKTCGYQLKEAILVHQNISSKRAKEQTLQWLKAVKLPEPATLFKRYPHQLSGGQKQRLMIAMALCNHPKILIADEPTTALDVTVQEEIVRLMKELQSKFGIALLFITHDLNLAKMIADDFLVMENGQVIHSYQESLVPKVKSEIIVDKTEIVPLLKAENLSVYYTAEKKLFQKDKEVDKAVDNVSFFINSSETLGLVGESGCGKSTLSKAIMGLQPISKGKLFFEGEEIHNNRDSSWRQIRREIQIIFQDPFASLNPRIKVGDALKEPMWAHRIVSKNELEKEVEQLLSLVQMSKAAKDKYPHEFSGGQRQRICIARALSLKPKLIICDESVAALDVKLQGQILKLLQDLQREQQLTYLFITHDLNVVRAISNRIMVMEKGKIVEQGLTENIMMNPETAYTQKLLAAIPNPDKRIN